jgi:hypothetical protein
MRKEDFKTWLRDSYVCKNGSAMADAAIATRIANCKRVEDFEGDLDKHASEDGMAGLLSRLNYSMEDQRQGVAPRHSVHIEGNRRDGSASLKSAVNLYKQFYDAWSLGAPGPKSRETRPPLPGGGPKPKAHSHVWPTWPQPTEIEALSLAKIVMPYVRFLNPDIVAAIVKDNELHRKEWSQELKARGINPEVYLWERSACAFPGVRRYAGSREIALYRGHAKNDETKFEQALRLDDNDCPKHIWSFTFLRKKFPKHGPNGYALAHLADHKKYGNRFEHDFCVVDGRPQSELFGLYSCPTNTVFIPTSMIKPTDFGVQLRNLLLQRAEHLYKEYCSLLPDWLNFRPAPSAAWAHTEFDWAAPVGDTTGVEEFLDYRGNFLNELFGATKVDS